MKIYYKRKLELEPSTEPQPHTEIGKSSKEHRLDIDIENLSADPALRPTFIEYNVQIRDQVRRAYVIKGPCQPRTHNFPQREFGTPENPQKWRFSRVWFDVNAKWLEYSISEDAAYCLCCYLFKPDIGDQSGGETCVSKGFTNWKKWKPFVEHVGGIDSTHNLAMNKFNNILDQRHHIQIVFEKQSVEAKNDYRIRLTASVDCIRYLLRQGLAFRGRDESEDSNSRGNFLELLEFLVEQNETVRAVALRNAPENLKLTSRKIQKDIVLAAAAVTTKNFIMNIGDSLFSVLVDESRDVSCKEQMVVVLRFVDKKGSVIECFLGIKHVPNTTALSLKKALEELFSSHGLRGQGYDGASNMQGEFNGLKTLIMKDNPYAYFVHCFPHQLQLALVGLARHHLKVGNFFNMVSMLVNVVGASCKRRDILMDKQAEMIKNALTSGELQSGKGLNQETNLTRPGDTRRGSHYGSLLSLMGMFGSVLDVLETVKKDGSLLHQRIHALALYDSIQSFEFIFILHLLKIILGITNDFSIALQKRDQNIVNAMSLVKVSKQRLQMMRENGWESLLDEVSTFCGKHDVLIPNMNDIRLVSGRSRRNVEKVTNLYHYRATYFYTVIDLQVGELDNRFNETSTELLLCLACLSPCDSFHDFDKVKLIRLAHFHPQKFSTIDLLQLADQLC